MKSKFAKRDILISYNLFSFYNKRPINESNKIKDYKEFITICSKIWEVVARKVVESEGGVVLDRFGYLCNWVTPKKRVFKNPFLKNNTLITNYHTDSYFYNTSLFTNIFYRDFLKGWSLDKSLNKNIKKALYENLKKGKKYKFYYSLTKRLYTDRHLKTLD